MLGLSFQQEKYCENKKTGDAAMEQSREKSLWLFFLACLTTFIMLGNGQKVLAKQTVDQMNINVALNDRGAANITEDWSVTADEGSEIYKVVKLVGPQQLSDYRVSMDGQTFSRTSNWDISASKSQKAYHYGQNRNELNWGLTSYGTHE